MQKGTFCIADSGWTIIVSRFSLRLDAGQLGVWRPEYDNKQLLAMLFLCVDVNMKRKPSKAGEIYQAMTYELTSSPVIDRIWGFPFRGSEQEKQRNGGKSQLHHKDEIIQIGNGGSLVEKSVVCLELSGPV